MNEGGNMVYMCQEMGIETGIDLDALIEATLLAERIIGRPLGGASSCTPGAPNDIVNPSLTHCRSLAEQSLQLFEQTDDYCDQHN